jgi:hypothetical protein
MIDFKNWLRNENLSGPGGGPESKPEDLEALNANISDKGAGAFNTYGEYPPTTFKINTKKRMKRFSKKS